MAISSSLPSINPIPIMPLTGRGPVTGSEASDPSASRTPEKPRVTDEAPESRGEDAGARKRAGAAPAAEPGLDEAQLKQLQQLKARDREVRTHEQAHQAVGGQYAGAVSYTYQRGPDGNQYAVGGEVPIDLSPVEGDPEATIEKMRTVQAAAMAPAQPSGQDRAVAAQAMQLLLQAQITLAEDGHTAEAGGQDREPGRTDSISASNAYQEVSGMVEPATDRAAFEAMA